MPVVRAGLVVGLMLGAALATAAPVAPQPSHGSPIELVYASASEVFGHRKGEPPAASVAKLMLARTTQIAALETALEIARNPSCAGAESYAECADIETYHSLLFDAVGLVRGCPPRQRPERLIMCLVLSHMSLSGAATDLSGQAEVAIVRLRAVHFAALWRAWIDEGQPHWTAWPNLTPAIPLAEAEQLRVLRWSIDVSALEAAADLLDRLDHEINADAGDLAGLDKYAESIASSAARLKQNYRPGDLGAQNRIAADGERVFAWYRHLEDWLSAARGGVIPSLEAPARAPAPVPAPTAAAPSEPAPSAVPAPGGGPGSPQGPYRERPPIWNKGGQPVHARPNDNRGDFLGAPLSDGSEDSPPPVPSGTGWSNVAPPGLAGPDPKDRPAPGSGHQGFGPPGEPRSGQPPEWYLDDSGSDGETSPAAPHGTNRSRPTEEDGLDGSKISATTNLAAALVKRKITEAYPELHWPSARAGWAALYAGLELSGTMDRFWRDAGRSFRQGWQQGRADRTRERFLEGMRGEMHRSTVPHKTEPNADAGDGEPERPPSGPEAQHPTPKIHQWLRRLFIWTAKTLGNAERDSCGRSGCRPAGGIRG